MYKKVDTNQNFVEREKELRPAQQYMKEHKDENLIVVAPSGSGMSEAALLWLDGDYGFYMIG